MPVGCHTWRAIRISIYLEIENDGRLQHAQQITGQANNPNSKADKGRDHTE
jgi:hypothetical protein